MNYTIKLNTIEKVKSFINEISKIDGDFDLIADKHFVVDAKSIMGIFSLDLARPLTLSGRTDSKELKQLAEKYPA